MKNLKKKKLEDMSEDTWNDLPNVEDVLKDLHD